MNQLATNFLARLHPLDPLDRGERKNYRSRMIPQLGIGFEADVNVGMMRKPSYSLLQKSRGFSRKFQVSTSEQLTDLNYRSGHGPQNIFTFFHFFLARL